MKYDFRHLLVRFIHLHLQAFPKPRNWSKTQNSWTGPQKYQLSFHCHECDCRNLMNFLTVFVMRSNVSILTVSKSYYFSASLTGCYSNEGLWAGRGSWTNAGDCSLNTSSCERTMSSLRPTEPGRCPDTRSTSHYECHVELTLVLCTSLKYPTM